MSNSASRLHVIASEAVSYGGKDPTALALWVSVFDIVTTKRTNITVQAAQRLVWVDDELMYLIDYLKDVKRYPEAGYSDVRSGVRNAASPALLNARVEHVKQHLTPAVVASLFQMGLNLPSEEEPISTEHLSVLEAFLDDLVEQAQTIPMGSPLWMIFNRHIALLQRAIDAYPIFGIRAFSDALRDAVGDLIAMKDRTVRGEGSDEMTAGFDKLQEIWGHVYRYIESADKVRKFAVLLGYGLKGLAWLDGAVKSLI
jgi:hypothetical protein